MSVPTLVVAKTLPRAGVLAACVQVLRRDLRLAVRRPTQLIQPLVFFAVVTLLFPLGYTPELGKLRAIAPGVLWVAALLASMLTLDSLFREDATDGTLEQFVVSGQPLVALLAAKTLAHWLLTGLPLTLMAPILGIADPRRDKRIDFVGGIRGLGELERRVDSGEMALALALHPTSMDDLMAVADANEVMPPKSTWFEPKLADGLASHLLP